MKPEESLVSITMQDAFGCVVENRFFQLLDDESDPLDFLNQASSDLGRKKKKEDAAAKKASKLKSNKKESQKERKAVTWNSEAPALNQAPKRSVHSMAQNGNGSEATDEMMSERKAGFREFHTDVFDKPAMYSVDNLKYEKERQVRDWLATQRGGMRGGGRGFPRFMENGNQRGKREFERHSGNDRAIRAEDKRGGGGPHNWGSFKDAFSDVEPVPVEATEPVDPACDVIENEPNSKSAGDHYEDFAKEMSLDEWKSFVDQSRPKAEFNLRKPDSKVPAKATVIHKSKFLNNLKEDEDDNHCNFRKAINDITSQLDINFGSLSRPARGGRGGGRGRFRREEAFSYDVSNVPTIDLDPDDPDAFPALI
ncbi:intracellular hyaluronan-binding protein 4 isoform 2-T2 [Anomaloglossus baeobatrachus]